MLMVNSELKILRQGGLQKKAVELMLLMELL